VIPREWADRVEAPPGKILVIRDEVALRVAGIWLPQGYRAHTRRAIATVLSIGPGCPEVAAVGERVLLAPSTGKKMVFGYTKNDEVEVWAIPPYSILAVLSGDADAVHGKPKPGKDDAYIVSADGEPEDRFDEGDPRGLR